MADHYFYMDGEPDFGPGGPSGPLSDQGFMGYGPLASGAAIY